MSAAACNIANANIDVLLEPQCYARPGAPAILAYAGLGRDQAPGIGRTGSAGHRAYPAATERGLAPPARAEVPGLFEGANMMRSGFRALRAFRRSLVAVVAALAPSALAESARAAEGQAEPWQLGLQEAVTPVAADMTLFHNFLLVIIAGITLLVLALLIYVMVRFNEKANPQPSRTTHNTLIEVVWTVVPVLILIVIAIPSFRLMFTQYSYPEADLTIKATGHQWYWSYEYPDHDGLAFDSIMLEEDQLEADQPRLLAVDNEVVVPVGSTVHVLVTSSDVIHSWAVPAFGVKTDAVPGRVIKTWFRAKEEGTYYGQCSELCGQRHAFMPITVRVVSGEEFDEWLAEAKQEFAASHPASGRGRPHAGSTKVALGK
jgi:cytochrome c oxidase subunit 2